MESFILGKIGFDLPKLQHDIAKLNTTKFSDSYSEFAYGEWETCVLWNSTGEKEEATIRTHKKAAVPTEIGQQLSYINFLIAHHFDPQYLRFARIFSASNNGLVIPHRDYLELHEPFQRIHIPLQTNLSCFNSEEDHVFHMAPGEVWYLDAAKTHSAACFSNIRRLHLVLDFDGISPIKKNFKATNKTEFYPNIIPREKLPPDFLGILLNFSHIICEENFRHIVAILAGIHFKKEANAADMFHWLKIIAHHTKNTSLIAKAESVYKNCIVCRKA